ALVDRPTAGRSASAAGLQDYHPPARGRPETRTLETIRLRWIAAVANSSAGRTRSRRPDHRLPRLPASAQPLYRRAHEHGEAARPRKAAAGLAADCGDAAPHHNAPPYRWYGASRRRYRAHALARHGRAGLCAQKRRTTAVGADLRADGAPD